MVAIDFDRSMNAEMTAHDMGVNNHKKEDHIKYLQDRINARRKTLDELASRIERISQANARDMIRLDELRLLKDIRDGRVNLVHAQTGKPINIHVFKNV